MVITPVTRVTFSLVLLTASLLFLAQMFGFAPDRSEEVRASRKHLTEVPVAGEGVLDHREEHGNSSNSRLSARSGASIAIKFSLTASVHPMRSSLAARGFSYAQAGSAVTSGWGPDGNPVDAPPRPPRSIRRLRGIRVDPDRAVTSLLRRHTFDRRRHGN